jgi:hypothetical protein
MKKCYIHKNGEIVWGNLSVYAIKDQTGKPVRIMTMVKDIIEGNRWNCWLNIVLDKKEDIYILISKYSSLPLKNFIIKHSISCQTNQKCIWMYHFSYSSIKNVKKYSYYELIFRVNRSFSTNWAASSAASLEPK